MPALLPFHSVFSLRPVVQIWQDMALSPGEAERRMAQAVIELAGGAEAFAAFGEDGADVPVALQRVLVSVLLPVAETGLAARALTVPFHLNRTFATPTYEALCPRIAADALSEERTMLAYHHVLRTEYGVRDDFSLPLLCPIEGDGALLHHILFDLDARYCDVSFEGAAPDLPDDVLDALVMEPMNRALWEKHLPPDQITLRGFTVVRGVDVTPQHAFSELCRLLLSASALTSGVHLDALEHAFRMFFGVPDLRVGFLLFERSSARQTGASTSWFGEDISKHTGTVIIGARPVGRSLALDGEAMPFGGGTAGTLYAEVPHAEVFLINDDLRDGTPQGLEKVLADRGLCSLIVAPMRYEQKLIGLLELASPTPGALHHVNRARLEEAVSLLTVALKRTADEEEDRLQAIIKKAFTAIYPVVEWRFRRAARTALERSRVQAGPLISDTMPSGIEPIVFPGVYGLYALSDIRGSSDQRNAAIQSDLTDQLNLARDVTSVAFDKLKLPAYDELRFHVDRMMADVVDGLTAEEESRALGFLQYEFEPTLSGLAAQDRDVAKAVERYRAALDPSLGIVYRARRTFEESVARINEAVSALLDGEQEALQNLVPHYFEKFKTDGVEYTLYVGEALVESGVLPPLALRSLRVWQIVTACRIQHLTEKLRGSLPLPLELAHLILVQGAPLTIRFRTDERRFDVDGAYNVRYEIMKKRVEKARIVAADGKLGGRLTQPGQIAIVYTTDAEANEYREYLQYLTSRGFIVGEVEALDLEDLQGVKGLRALRARIAPASEAAASEPALRLVRGMTGNAAGA